MEIMALLLSRVPFAFTVSHGTPATQPPLRSQG
jgi:hypothetical protein